MLTFCLAAAGLSGFWLASAYLSSFRFLRLNGEAILIQGRLLARSVGDVNFNDPGQYPGRLAQLSAQVAEAASRAGARVLVVDHAGFVIIDSVTGIRRSRAWRPGLPEIDRVIGGQTISRVHAVSPDGRGLVVVAMPIIDTGNDRLVGAVYFLNWTSWGARPMLPALGQ